MVVCMLSIGDSPSKSRSLLSASCCTAAVSGDLSMGDLSMGDPGYNAAGYGSDAEGDSGDWWNADSELLRAPKRAAGLGINYNHSAKQVGSLLDSVIDAACCSCG